MKYISFILFFCAQQILAQAPLPEKKTLKLDILEVQPFVEYQKFRELPRAPIGMGLKINNNYVPVSELSKYFAEHFYAYVPSPILIPKDNDHWQYPVGTQIVHLVRLNDPEKTLFELRMIEKRTDGIWSFGTYLPKENEWQLIDSSTESKNVDIEYVTEDQIRVRLQMGTVPQQVCANCHRGTTTHNWPKDSPDAAGPCEMTPENPNLMTDWKKDFENKLGWSPFEKQ